jgi:hypothetical protein
MPLDGQSEPHFGERDPVARVEILDSENVEEVVIILSRDVTSLSNFSSAACPAWALLANEMRPLT